MTTHLEYTGINFNGCCFQVTSTLVDGIVPFCDKYFAPYPVQAYNEFSFVARM